MSLIDSSAWIELFRATGSPTHERLRAALSSDDELVSTNPSRWSSSWAPATRANAA
jgi:hypothetical protein